MPLPAFIARLKERFLPWIMNLYPPYLGAGIRVRRLPPASAGDPRGWQVRMKLRWWNRNYVGTHFGGSLYSMVDPFYMLILFGELGKDHVVWDKAATIHFLRPGKGTVTARFEIPRERVEEIRRQAAESGKVEPEFRAEVLDERTGERVAVVEKVCYVRPKERASKGA